VEEVCRKLGISQKTFYRSKQKFAGLGDAELRRLRQLEEENNKIKTLVEDLSLDKRMHDDVVSGDNGVALLELRELLNQPRLFRLQRRCSRLSGAKRLASANPSVRMNPVAATYAILRLRSS